MVGSGRSGTLSGNRPDTVLVVENEVLVRLAISEYLRHSGYRVIEVASADEAMMLLAQADIAVDVVFSAVELGGGADGFAVTTGDGGIRVAWHSQDQFSKVTALVK